MKRILIFSIIIFSIFAQSVLCQDLKTTEIKIKYFNKTIYYPQETVDNPVYVHITVANRGAETVRFKLADDRMFSVDFTVYDAKNTMLPKTDNVIRKRTTNNTVYFREISIEPGEEYSFVENLKEFIKIDKPGLYYADVTFYPELYKSKLIKLTSNRLSLDIKPFPGVAASGIVPVDRKTMAVLKPEPLSPDAVIEHTLVSRQNNQWDAYFLYFDIEQMLMNDPVRNRKYRMLSAEERQRMITNYKTDLRQQRIETDIVSVPYSFSIERTTYTATEGTISVLEWFKYDTFNEKKRYTYFVRKRDGIWLIYNYSVENLGAE
jgi:hypothetical protein